MPLALGPLQLDPTVRTVVVGLVTVPASPCVEPLGRGADVLWLPGAARPGHVADAVGRSGLPVGVTVDDPALLGDLVGAGAVAFEPSGAVDVTDLLGTEGLAVWCTPAQARRAVEAGISQDRIVVEPGGSDDPGCPGVTVVGAGPATWGAVLRDLLAGARVVRITDVASARRVVTVADRLLSARAAAREEIPS